MRFLKAVVKRLWFLIPGGLLGAVDVIERLADVEIAPPTWIFWVVLFAGFTLAVLLAHHDLRTVDLREVDTLTRERDEARRQLVSSGMEVEEDNRHIVNVTPGHLAGFFEAHTDIQARKLVESYLGQWLRVSGPLHNVSTFSYGVAFVSFVHGTYDHLTIQLIFSDQKVVENRLAVVSRGTEITVLGQIKDVDHYVVRLENCELVKVAG
ncbi:MAG: OB-fold putative lipoprotein [Actinobacteria bacterium]|nr:OB-fold putative lipoprotein [Actinomycetota bacterium]